MKTVRDVTEMQISLSGSYRGMFRGSNEIFQMGSYFGLIKILYNVTETMLLLRKYSIFRTNISNLRNDIMTTEKRYTLYLRERIIYFRICKAVKSRMRSNDLIFKYRCFVSM